MPAKKAASSTTKKSSLPKGEKVESKDATSEAKKTTTKVVKKTTTQSAKKTKTADPSKTEVAKATETAKVVKKAEPQKKAEKVEIKEKPNTQQSNNSTTSSSYQPEFDLTELLETGAHFGHQARRWHPKMAPYIYDKRGDVHIFDLIKTAELLKKACQFAYELGKNNRTLIFVGTKRQAKDIVKKEAEAAGAMYVINRWLGGFLTNWGQVSKSLKEMIDTQKGLEEDRFKHYTKKERVVLAKKIERLERFFGGVTELKKSPDALFLIDIGREDTALREAVAAGVPVIGIVDTNCDPTDVDYVIPANDDAVNAIEYIVHAIAEAYQSGKSSKK